ncbi:MAG: DUF378 domain-containing protein [Bacilli bacterium]|nr:DUF378 domain-containing protein [Bacilli bacterium]
MRTLQSIALTLTIIGAINWGLVGLFDFNLVALIFGGADSILTKLIYIIVGICGIINIKLLIDYATDND